MESSDEFVTVAEAAKRIGVPEWKLRRVLTKPGVSELLVEEERRTFFRVRTVQMIPVSHLEWFADLIGVDAAHLTPVASLEQAQTEQAE